MHSSQLSSTWFMTDSIAHLSYFSYGFYTRGYDAYNGEVGEEERFLPISGKFIFIGLILDSLELMSVDFTEGQVGNLGEAILGDC